MTIGFIGLGRMGRGMAANIARNHSEALVVYDVNPDAMAALVGLGATAAGSVAEVVAGSRVLFTSLPGPTEIEEVVLGADGVIAHIQPGSTYVDLSTSSYELVGRIEHAVGAQGADMLDAPVSGGPAGAESGTLALWVGGERELFDRHLPLLQSFASDPRYVGELGLGTITKLANNMAAHMIKLALAEVFSMAVRAGIDPLDLWEHLRVGFVGRRSPLDLLTNQFLPGRYDSPANTLAIAHKDMSLGAAAGRALGVPMRLAALTQEEMTEAMRRGFADEDARSYLKLQLQRAGVEIAVDPKRLAEALAADSPRP